MFHLAMIRINPRKKLKKSKKSGNRNSKVRLYVAGQSETKKYIYLCVYRT